MYRDRTESSKFTEWSAGVAPRLALAVCLLLLCGTALGAAPALDERPGRPGEWGFRPADGAVVSRNPPPLSVRPQKMAAAYTFEIYGKAELTIENLAYVASGDRFNVHCPSTTLGPGTWYWRFRFTDRKNRQSAWSRTRSFTVPESAREFPFPSRAELLGRVPAEHPRLFLRPEDLPALKARADEDTDGRWARLVARCDKLLADPPPTAEPKKYPKGTESRGEEWRKIWWGNRRYTIRVLESAATLGFVWRVTGKEKYGREAKRLLLEAAKWDPRGATGYRYNDEAGMPYAYHLARTYTFINDLLTEEEREACREVIRVRGKEMYLHLCPNHFWHPYGSHQNRAWHFLGEVGIAFLGEIPEAADWLWFALNVFANVYPVWSDADGGWSEGSNYWSSYVGRFTWWADVMKSAVGLDAFDLPYFSQTGYYPMYLSPPGTRGGGFGDLTARKTSSHFRGIMTVLAAQSANPHWRWYVDRVGGPLYANSHVDWLRSVKPLEAPRAPDDLPTSRRFRGTGLAVLNSNLADAKDNVSVHLKSSPFGTQSHGYESQNSFLLYAFGRRLLIRSGYRDMYGSPHHRLWMWQSKSTNCVSVNGKGQRAHSTSAVGKIADFHTSEHFEYAVGEAGSAYDRNVKRFTRGILFVKPDLIVIHDRLETASDSTFAWHLHSPTPMAVDGQDDIRIVNGEAACKVTMLAPGGLELSLTDKFDPAPRPRVKLTEYHLTAVVPGRTRAVTFVTVIRPHRSEAEPPPSGKLEKTPDGLLLTAPVEDGVAKVLLRNGGVAATLYDSAGERVAAFSTEPRER